MLPPRYEPFKVFSWPTSSTGEISNNDFGLGKPAVIVLPPFFVDLKAKFIAETAPANSKAVSTPPFVISWIFL